MYLACQLYYRYLSDNENSLNVSYCTLLCLLLVIQNCVKCTLLLSCDGRKFLYESWGKYTSTALVQVVVTVLYTTSIKYVRIILQHDRLMYRDMYYIPSMYSSVNHVTRRVQSCPVRRRPCNQTDNMSASKYLVVFHDESIFQAYDDHGLHGPF